MRIGIPLEPDPQQTIVVATPETVGKLVKLGYEVAVQVNAGMAAKFTNADYESVGAIIVDESVWHSGIVVTLDTPPEQFRALLNDGATLISRLAPGRSEELVEELAQRNIAALAMDAAPRISRAQSMDVLSLMANIGGYRAVVKAASAYGRLFTGQMIAAGKMPPVTVYVIGAGVGGLAAVGTANSMGTIVKATNPRPEAGEQVESMGAEFILIPTATEKSGDGYAREMTNDQAAATAKLYPKQSAQADIVITTADIPSRRSPLLLTVADVAAMKPSSVIVDMAAAGGGSCEMAVSSKTVVTDNGVTIIDYTDLAGHLPAQASSLYGQNIFNLFKLITPEKDGSPVFNLEDEVIRGITATKARPQSGAGSTGAEILWPPPPIEAAVTPAAPLQEQQAHQAALEESAPEKVSSMRSGMGSKIALGLTVLLAIVVMLSAPHSVSANFMVLTLAIVSGFYVISAVAPRLHTPLMSETNAISGIALVGAILQVGSSNLLVSGLTFTAIVVSSTNIFGGFAVIDRMLSMFVKEEAQSLAAGIDTASLLDRTYRLSNVGYITAAILFLAALSGLSKPETARRGNAFGIAGMAVAVVIAIFQALVTADTKPGTHLSPLATLILITVAVGIGSVIGIIRARSVAMTGMPQLIALFNGLVGLGTIFVGFDSYIFAEDVTADARRFHLGEVYIGVFIGAVTLTGPIVVGLKLSEKIKGSPLLLPGRDALNIAILVITLVLPAVLIVTNTNGGAVAWACVVGVTVLGLFLGWHLVIAIGGGGIPVVVSIMNSYSGWAAASTGLMLGDPLLIIAGALVGSSGAYLSYVMCEAMNRSFTNVILGGFSSEAASASIVEGSRTEVNHEDTTEILHNTDKILIAPGYGMAVAQAQYAVVDLVHNLRADGKEVVSGIHPVVSRLPGHMNVLLAETKVPHGIVLELDEINDDFADVNVTLVIGANDTVNPMAEQPGSPIAGIPVLKVWESERVIVLKRSMGSGYSGVQNPLFFNENADMLIGDAKVSIDSLNRILSNSKVNAQYFE